MKAKNDVMETEHKPDDVGSHVCVEKRGLGPAMHLVGGQPRRKQIKNEGLETQ
jgi:hypothetical protein